jgi:hypothetical protein
MIGVKFTQKKTGHSEPPAIAHILYKNIGGREFLVWKFFDNVCFKSKESDKGILYIGDGNFSEIGFTF